MNKKYFFTSFRFFLQIFTSSTMTDDAINFFTYSATKIIHKFKRKSVNRNDNSTLRKRPLKIVRG